MPDLNQRPVVYKTTALPTELIWRTVRHMRCDHTVSHITHTLGHRVPTCNPHDASSLWPIRYTSIRHIEDRTSSVRGLYEGTPSPSGCARISFSLPSVALRQANACLFPVVPRTCRVPSASLRVPTACIRPSWSRSRRCLSSTRRSPSS